MQDIDNFNYFIDQFEDIRVLRYQLPGFKFLTLQQKKLIYYLSQAALSGRDILWDQNFRYNMLVRKTLEAILDNYSGDKESAEYKAFLIYAKRVFFANGIHHHYSNDKLKPGYSESYFASLIDGTNRNYLLLSAGQTVEEFIFILTDVIFNEKLFGRKVEQRKGTDMVAESAVNFYENVNQKEVEDFYKGKIDPQDPHPVSIGLNSKVSKKEGKIIEDVYKSGGLYGQVIDQIVIWLEKAIIASDSEMQRKEIGLLIDYYRSGDLKVWTISMYFGHRTMNLKLITTMVLLKHIVIR